MPATPADAAARILQYFDDLNGDRAEFAAWASGTVLGGPNGDGLYPLSTFTGMVTLVPCPARIAANSGGSGGGLSPETIAALALIDAIDIGASTLLALTAGGELKRVGPFMFAARRTADLSVLQGSEFAEQLSCLSNTGAERRIALSAIQRAVGNVIDPTHPPYNVVYDFNKHKLVDMLVGSNVVTARDGDSVFRQTDRGKLIVVGNVGSDGAVEGVIGVVSTNGNQVQVFTDLSFNTPLNATNAQSGGTECIWGTDCTAGLQAAMDAAEPQSPWSLGRVVVMGGMAMIRTGRFGSISVVGLSSTGCGIVSLPVANSTTPTFADKTTGAYASLRPDNYTLRNLNYYGQRYTQKNSGIFRELCHIRGGNFDAFQRGAPYAMLSDLTFQESPRSGFKGRNAFAGQMNNIRCFFNAAHGMVNGFWDLNGTDWHAEGNGLAGFFSIMAGANVGIIRASYNGEGAKTAANAHRHGSQWVECGGGNTISNMRLQESWSHSLCFSSLDTDFGVAAGPTGNAYFMSTFDDTGNISQLAVKDGRPGFWSNLPGVRAIVYVEGTAAFNNTVDLSTGGPHVHPINYATNAYWDQGGANNRVTLRTGAITNDPADWYAGSTRTPPHGPPATARGPFGTSAATPISARSIVTVNGQAAP